MFVLSAWSAWSAFVPVAGAATIEITVTDPAVREVVLECAEGGTYRATPRNGVVTFENSPKSCQVVYVRRSGTIDAPGKWTCTADACTRTEVEHLEVTDAPGRVNVIVTSQLPPGVSLELTCGAYRERAPVVTNTATFEGVPAEDCTLYFKGSIVGKYRPVVPGTWSCHLSGSTTLCSRTPPR